MDDIKKDSDVKQAGVMFDSQLVEFFMPTITEAFAEHADVLRSVIVSFDFYGPFNDTEGVSKGIWLGSEGAQTDPSGIIGSAGVTLQAAATIIDRGFQLLGGVREELEKTLQELKERREELEQVKTELGSIRDTGGASSSTSDPAS